MPAQASLLPHVMRPLLAVLVTVDPQDDVPLHVSVHWLPPQTIGPAQELACAQEMVQLLALEQSTPPAQAEVPQVT